MGCSPATTVGYAMVAGDSSEAIAQPIRADGIDLPIDLMGHTHHGRPGVLALRLAPLHLHRLGYPGSLGAERSGSTHERVSRGCGDRAPAPPAQ